MGIGNFCHTYQLILNLTRSSVEIETVCNQGLYDLCEVTYTGHRSVSDGDNVNLRRLAQDQTTEVNFELEVLNVENASGETVLVANDIAITEDVLEAEASGAIDTARSIPPWLTKSRLPGMMQTYSRCLTPSRHWMSRVSMLCA